MDSKSIRIVRAIERLVARGKIPTRNNVYRSARTGFTPKTFSEAIIALQSAGVIEVMWRAQHFRDRGYSAEVYTVKKAVQS